MVDTRQRTVRGIARAAHVGGKSAGEVRLKRAYEAPEAADGYRVLVDRLWPRGVRKDALAIEAWMKEIGPSDELRRWFGHDASRWDDFALRYRDELRGSPAAGLVDELVARAKRGAVTLVYGAKDEVHNQAVVIRTMIEQRLRGMHARAPAVLRTTGTVSRARSRSPAAARAAPRPPRERALGGKRARAGGRASPSRQRSSQS